MNNKRYSITKYITGGCWIMIAVLGRFNSIVADVIRIAFLVLLVSVLIYQSGIKPDKPRREKSSAAKDFARTAVCYAYCAAAVLTFVISLLFNEDDWKWLFRIMSILSMTLGLIDIETGISIGKQRGQKTDGSDKGY